MKRNKIDVIGQPLSWIKISDKLNKLKNLMKTWKENEDSFLVFIWIIIEGILPFNDVADDDRGYSHHTFFDGGLV